MNRTNEMNWLDFGSMVKTPNLAFQDAVGVFLQFQEMVATNSILTRVSICSSLDVTEGS